MGPCEPEDFCYILPDEGDCGPRLQQAIHHHMVSVWPISASTGCLESFPRGASRGAPRGPTAQRRVGAVRPRRPSRLRCRCRVK
ncbi:hypothetical protein T02_14036 [Trichinella nativa]|uniref:Uncharacterized protein n=1 Tax=Trichinella nativa TaxID=6335 RepID=A0A0V1KKX2_9BILA|nr:hypothetical protein T02_14036 [Trichinella nativa]